MEIITKSAIEYPIVIDKLLPYLEGHNGYIAGGAFKDIFTGRVLRDIDIFFENQNDFDYAVKYFSQKYKHAYRNENAIAYRDEINNLNIELIKRNFCKPYDLISKFDFTVSMFALVVDFKNPSMADGYKCIFNKDFFDDLVNKRIIIKNYNNAVSVLKRVYKYISYGYTIDSVQNHNLVNRIRAMSEKEINQSNNEYVITAE